MDFLGLRNLDVIEDAVEIIERSRGAQIDIEAIPLDDPKTFEMLSERRLDRRLPARVRRDARRAAPGSPDRLQRHRRPGLAVQAGRDAVHRRLRERQARPRVGPLRGPSPAPDHRVHLRLLHLPGAADGDRQADGRVQPRRGRRPAQGGGEEEARPDGADEGQVPRRPGGVGHRSPGCPGPVVADDRGGRLLASIAATRPATR